MAAGDINTYGAIRSMTGEGKAAYASQIYDEAQGKFQDQINQETANEGLVSAKVVQTFTDAEKEQARTNIGAYTKPNGGIPKSDLTSDVQSSLDNADAAAPQSTTYTKTEVDELLEAQDEEIAKKANSDGYYEQLVSGGALALIGQTQRANDAMYRKSGDIEEVTTGTATIANIKGQTKPWNQLLSYYRNQSTTVNGVTITNNNNGTYSVSTDANGATADTAYTIFSASPTVSFMGVAGHKYFLVGCPTNGSVSSYYLNDGYYNRIDTGSGVITDFGSRWISIRITVKSGTIITTPVIFTPQVFDLTLIYEAGNEPTTVAQFEADYLKWFGKPLTYEEYDAGSLRSVQLDAIKTTGFNQWDEEWEVGAFSTTTGEKTNYQCIRSKNFIPVISGATYYVKQPGLYYGIWFYDKDKNYLSYSIISPGRTPTFNIPDNCRYINFVSADAYGTTYNHDICINISDPAKNGTYEPYEVHTAPLPVTTMTGKLNGEGESVTIFPDGMKSAGTIADEIYTVGDKTYAVKRVGAVDLGSLTWTLQTSVSPGQATSSLPLKKPNPSTLLSAYFAYIANRGAQVNNRQISDTIASNRIWVEDNSISATTPDGYAQALSGVMLNYELAEPLVYEVDGFTLPKTYLVDGGGTEEQVQKTSVQGLAAILTCIYGVDAVGILDKLPRNYISESSMDNFLAKLNIATGGTWSKTFNENTGEWDFNYTPAAQTNANTNEESI